jgi:hypothetical protein
MRWNIRYQYEWPVTCKFCTYFQNIQLGPIICKHDLIEGEEM